MSLLKRRCQSLPQFRKKIYSKIGKNYQQQQWKIFLKNSHQLSSTLQQFTKVQFDIRNQDNFKFTTRSILMMKRDIIKYLQRDELQEGLKKLKDLEQKVNANEIKKVKMMIIYLECRQEMEKGLTSGKEEHIICKLKDRMSQFINGNEITLIKIKILTILSILLLRFHGILMTNDEKLIIFKTIDLKKKIILQIDRKQQKQAQFQCLLYLLLQLYKILYLLKKDQQTILFYYNQLHAYTQIYLKKQDNKEDLDVIEIQKVLANMKPILNQLDIYEDSKLRKELAFAHIQQQVIQQQNSSSKNLQEKKQQQRKRLSSNIKISSGKLFRRSNNIQNSNKLTLGLSSLRREISIESCIQNILEIEKYPIQFEFLVVSQQQLYIASLSFKLRNACNLVDCQILIKRGISYREIFRLTGIQLIAQTLNFKSISRFLFKMINHFLQTNTQFQQINNIYYIEERVPRNMVSDDLITSFCRIKTLITSYMRQNQSGYSLIGNKFHFPIVNKSTIRIFIDKLRQLQKKKAKQIFSRRQGFILHQKHTFKPHTEKCVKILMKRQMQKTLQYYFLNVFFQHIFKGIQIYYLNVNDQEVQIGENINLLKRTNDWIIINKRKMVPRNIIRSILSQQVKMERVLAEKKEYRAEEQLQINQEKLKSEIIPVKFQRSKKIKMKVPQSKKQFEMVKMEKSYFLFLRQNIGDLILYKSDKAKLFLPSNWKQLQWSLSKIRLRLYKSIKTHIHSGKQKKYIKYYGQQMAKTSEQYVALVLLKHKILLKDKGYSVLLIYETPQNKFLYEIIYNKYQRYYYISQKELEIPRREYQEKLLKKYLFYPYQGMRQKISEANWYYLNIAKKKQLGSLERVL